MSNAKNTLIIERAYELIDELASDPAGRDDALLALIKADDIDTLYRQVVRIEAELSQEHFLNSGILERGDEY